MRGVDRGGGREGGGDGGIVGIRGGGGGGGLAAAPPLPCAAWITDQGALNLRGARITFKIIKKH